MIVAINGNIFLNEDKTGYLELTPEQIEAYKHNEKIKSSFYDKKVNATFFFTNDSTKQDMKRTLSLYNILVETLIEDKSQYIKLCNNSLGIYPLINIPTYLKTRYTHLVNSFLEKDTLQILYTNSSIGVKSSGEDIMSYENEWFVSVFSLKEKYPNLEPKKALSQLRQEIVNYIVEEDKAYEL